MRWHEIINENNIIQGPWGQGGAKDPIDRKDKPDAGLQPINQIKNNAPEGFLTDEEVAEQFIPEQYHDEWFELFDGIELIIGRNLPEKEYHSHLINYAHEWFKDIELRIYALDIDEHSDGFYWKIANNIGY